MGCNCGKRKRTNAAGKPKPATGTSTGQQSGQGGQQSSQGKTHAFVLTTPEGRQFRYGSQLEADAANVRGGGRGRVRTI